MKIKRMSSSVVLRDANIRLEAEVEEGENWKIAVEAFVETLQDYEEEMRVKEWPRDDSDDVADDFDYNDLEEDERRL